ncbi:unnamed protein product, partial [marine sediment metagenome]
AQAVAGFDVGFDIEVFVSPGDCRHANLSFRYRSTLPFHQQQEISSGIAL